MNDINVDETRAYLNTFDEMNMQEELELNKLYEHEDLDYFEVIFISFNYFCLYKNQLLMCVKNFQFIIILNIQKVNEIYKEIPEIVKRLQIHLRNCIFFQKKKQL